MNVGALLDRLDRLQKSNLFKVVASIIIAVAAVAIIGANIVRLQRDRAEMQFTAEPNEALRQAEERVKDDKERAEQFKALVDAQRNVAETTVKAINSMLAARSDPTAMAVGVSALALLAIGVVWIGQGLSTLAIVSVIALVAWPLIRYGEGGWRDAGRFVAAIGSLALSFVILMQLLRLAFSGSNPVIAIARNVVNEAVRIKVSLVFIVLLLFALAALPGLLDPATPLRYRVQSFLQYGTGGTFWIIAILVLFLAVSSVTFEQRDRVIWQTMTKPVAAWQYLLGKWLGVVGVAAVLLAVSSTGVFLFTEYLRGQRAVGEIAPYIPADPSQSLVTEDRRVLESQVLAARVGLRPDFPQLDLAAVQKELDERVRKARATDPNFIDSNAARSKLLEEFENEQRTQFFAIGGGDQREFTFSGLAEARRRGTPLTLRYRVDVGANDPKVVYRVTFGLPNMEPFVQQVPLGQIMTINVNPAAVGVDGVLRVRVLNGDMERAQAGDPDWANTETMSFPPDGLTVFYPVGSYHGNFLRVVIVQWLKLAFLAMIAICAGTFLSFSVASVVAFGTFLVAEGAKFLFDALEYYSATDTKGNVDYFRIVVRAIAVPISRMFHYYSNLRPTANLVDGRLVEWGTVLVATLVLGLATALLYLIAVTVFRRRELAMYSGH